MTDITQRLLEQVNEAITERSPVNIVGGNSKQFIGRASSATPLDVSKHQGIVSYEPVELVMTARSGTKISDIEAALDEHGQMLAFEPASFDGAATIAGTLACNLSGAARPWLGSVRDMILGTHVINGHGQLLRFGGQVMKNVAGYDVSRLQAGAMGTLGVMTQLSFKVVPQHQTSVTLTANANADEAIIAMNAIGTKMTSVTGCFWLDGVIYMRLSGSQSAVENSLKYMFSQLSSVSLLDDAASLWHDLNNFKHPFFEDDTPVSRFSIKSSAQHFHSSGSWLIDWGGAQRWLKHCDNDAIDRNELESFARDAGGQVSLFRGGDRTGEVNYRQDAAMQALMQRIKLAVDPLSIFNPGRLYQWL